MARYTGAIAKISRREGIALHPKAVKALEKRNYVPGQHGQSRLSKPSDYSVQMREKQKVKRLYGLLEKQFRRYVAEAERIDGVSGEILLQLLERRLDNVVYRMGLAPSRQGARQLVSHAHLTLNGRKVDVPSIIVKPGDVVSVKPTSQKKDYFLAVIDTFTATTPPSWLKIEPKKFTATVTGQPLREEVTEPITEQLIIEFYSR